MIYVFAGNEYYPSGGWHDLIGIVTTTSDAEALVEKWSKLEANYPEGVWAHAVYDGIIQKSYSDQKWHDPAEWDKPDLWELRHV